jgi:hypothetical protein
VLTIRPPISKKSIYSKPVNKETNSYVSISEKLQILLANQRGLAVLLTNQQEARVHVSYPHQKGAA